MLNSISSVDSSRLVHDTCRGNAWWVNRSEAVSQRLAYVNEKEQVVLKVDNSTYISANKSRNSIRIESLDSYGVGTLWVADIAHMPYGCSVSLHAQPVQQFISITNRGVAVGLACILVTW